MSEKFLTELTRGELIANSFKLNEQLEQCQKEMDSKQYILDAYKEDEEKLINQITQLQQSNERLMKIVEKYGDDYSSEHLLKLILEKKGE